MPVTYASRPVAPTGVVPRRNAAGVLIEEDPNAAAPQVLGPQGQQPSGYAQELMKRLDERKTSKIAPTSAIKSMTPAATTAALSQTVKGMSSPYRSQLSQIGLMGTNATAVQQAKTAYQQAQLAAQQQNNNNPNLNLLPNINATGARAAIIKYAQQQLGVPYSWGGGSTTGPSYGFAQGHGIKGFDCSGLVRYAYAKAGIKLPRVAEAQMRMGKKAPISKLQPGDLVGWGNPAHHIAIYLGGGKIIEAPRTGMNVRIIPLSKKGGGAWGIHLNI